MTIVELPDMDYGWAYIIVDNKCVATFWAEIKETRVKMQPISKMLIVQKQEKGILDMQIYADAIRRK